MSSIIYEVDEKQEETVSVFLMMMLEYVATSDLWQMLNQSVHIKMKEVTYGRLNKAQTVIAESVK